MKSYTLSMNDEADRELAQLAVASGYGRDAVLAAGIALFGVALKAELQGKHLAIVDAAGSVDTDIVGFLKKQGSDVGPQVQHVQHGG